MDDENVSMDELRAVLGSTTAVTSIPYELRPVGEIEGSQSRPGVPGDEGPVDTAVSRRSTVEPINAGWGRRLEDGSMVFPESRISEFCDQWNCMDHGAGLEGGERKRRKRIERAGMKLLCNYNLIIGQGPRTRVLLSTSDFRGKYN